MTNYLNKFNLSKKFAVIVGGLGLIGKEIVCALGSAGAKILILDINKSKALSFKKKLIENNYSIKFEFFDCEDLHNLEKNFLEILDRNHCPNILVNCSYPRTKDWDKSSFSELNFKSFRKNIEIHMNTYSWISRLTAEQMIKSKIKGSIINLSSIYGVRGQDLQIYEGTEMKENMTYSVIKGGITNLTRQMASYYGRNEIRINTLVAGGIDGHVAGSTNEQNINFKNQYSKRVPLKRLGLASEVASSVLFLASDASSYVTGSQLVVDGGWTAV